MDLSKLREPFPADDIEWRVQSAGKNGERIWARVLAYVTNRAIMERLDEVCGPENWRNEFTAAPEGGILCGISIYTNTGDAMGWVTKWDGAQNTDVEAVKGGLSGAMKRAGVQWGIGRYLYNLSEGFANVSPSGSHYQGANFKNNLPAFKWDPPELPLWALPGGTGKPSGAKPPKGPQPATSTQVDQINLLLDTKDVDIAKLKAWMREKYTTDDYASITIEQAAHLIDLLTKKGDKK